MESITALGLRNALEQRTLGEGVPFLGICIGLQILFEHSAEEDTSCLGWIPGQALSFPRDKVRVPHIGWNEVGFTHEHPILNGLGKKEFFYFVNSFYVVPNDCRVILGKTEYGVDFCSMLEYGNIFATQFHVEKSGVVGLHLLKNFLLLAGGKTYAN